jgi:hypothetical protein
MSDVRTAYGTSNQLVTITLTSLASSATAGREGVAISNTTDKFLDVLVSMKLKTQNSGSISAPSAAYLYVGASVDGGTSYPDALAGADANITINSPTQLKMLGVLYIAAINTTYKGGPWSVAGAFGGKLPEKYSFFVLNTCGTALTATGTDHVVSYQGVYATVT